MTPEHFDRDGTSRLSRRSCVTLLRAALDPHVTPPDVPGLRTGPGALSDRAVAVAATWAAPLLHVTVDQHEDGAVRSSHVHWAASGTVTSSFLDDAGEVREVRWDDPASFARTVVVAAGLADLPAAVEPRTVTATELSRWTGQHGRRLVTTTLVAPERGTDDLRAPGPRPGTEPVSRASVVGPGGLHRVEHLDGDRLVLVPWSGADEQVWFGQVLTGFRDRLADDPTR